MNKQALINRAKEIINSTHDLVVVVEGINDKKYVELMGYHRVITLNKPLFMIIEELLNEDRVIILTDLDEQGENLYRELRSELNKYGVMVDNSLRQILHDLGYSHIEGLKRFVDELSLD